MLHANGDRASEVTSSWSPVRSDVAPRHRLESAAGGPLGPRIRGSSPFAGSNGPLFAPWSLGSPRRRGLESGHAPRCTLESTRSALHSAQIEGFAPRRALESAAIAPRRGLESTSPPAAGSNRVWSPPVARSNRVPSPPVAGSNEAPRPPAPGLNRTPIAPRRGLESCLEASPEKRSAGFAPLWMLKSVKRSLR